MNSEENLTQTEEVTKECDERDLRSIFVGNVDYSASTEEIRIFFKECGAIERVTIPTDKFTKSPKGYAYIEFTDPSSVIKAESFNEKYSRTENSRFYRKEIIFHRLQGPGGFRPRRSYFFARPRSYRFRPVLDSYY